MVPAAFDKKPCSFVLNQKAVEVPAHSVIIYDKQVPHEYMASQTIYQNDWLHFDSNSDILKDLGLILNKPLLLSNPYLIYDISEKLASEFYSTNDYRNRSIQLLMDLLLVKIKEVQLESLVKPRHSLLHDQLIHLRKDIHSNPQKDWNIPDMAKSLHISIGHFQHIFKEQFTNTAMAEVIASRISKAQDLLMGTDLPIYEIAGLCGYQHDVHFMRQFKESTSMTPSQYRKSLVDNTIT